MGVRHDRRECHSPVSLQDVFAVSLHNIHYKKISQHLFFKTLFTKIIRENVITPTNQYPTHFRIDD